MGANALLTVSLFGSKMKKVFFYSVLGIKGDGNKWFALAL
jgi:hypothetical protein